MLEGESINNKEFRILRVGRCATELILIQIPEDKLFVFKFYNQVGNENR